jgi:hypothetical protein
MDLVLLTQGETSGLKKVKMEAWFLSFIREVLIVTTGAQQVNTECFLQSIIIKILIEPRVGHGHFLQDILQFTIHNSFCHRSYKDRLKESIIKRNSRPRYQFFAKSTTALQRYFDITHNTFIIKNN